MAMYITYPVSYCGMFLKENNTNFVIKLKFNSTVIADWHFDKTEVIKPI